MTNRGYASMKQQKKYERTNNEDWREYAKPKDKKKKPERKRRESFEYE